MSFPVIIQHDAMQCGIASLLMVCKHFGFSISLEEASKYCAVSKRGVSLLSISIAAKYIGLKPFMGIFTEEQLSHASLPCILHWNNNHFVVLYKITRDGHFLISDPGIGRVEYTRDEFIRHWIKNDGQQPHGIAMTLSKTADFPNKTLTEKTESSNLKFIFNYLSRFKGSYGIVVFSLIVGALLQLAFPYLTQWVVDKGISHRDVSLIWMIMLGEACILIGKTASDFLRRWILLHISIRVNISLITDFLLKLLKLPISFFDSRLLGDMIQRIADHNRVQSFLTGNALNLIFSVFTMMVFSLILCTYSTVTFLIFSVFSIAYALWITIFLKKRRIIDYELFSAQGELQSKTYQFITSIQEIILQNCNLRRCAEWGDSQTKAFHTQLRSLKLQQTQEGGAIFLNEAKNICITVTSALAVINGTLTLGEMLAIQYVVGQLNGPISQLVGFILTCQDVKISLERINEIHSKDNESRNRLLPVSGSLADATITFRNVCFKYNSLDTDDILKNINLRVPTGKTTAIVGASGSGKTTILKLLLGSYAVSSGSIKIGDMDIDDVDLEWWRRQCGVVMQDSLLFSESIERNIAVEDGDVDYDRMIEAAKIANIHDFISSLPLKYKTEVGNDGIVVSPGQRQRILIARAIYKNPKLMIFDEATNSLDTSNEKTITQNLTALLEHRTAIVVAHRLSTIVNADQIVVLDKGRIVEVGTHNQLLSLKGTYFQLVKNQLQHTAIS